MSGIDPQRAQTGSRLAGYVLGTLLGAPFAFVAVALIFRSPGLGVAAGLTAAVLGLTFAGRAWSEDRTARLSD